MDGMGLKLSIVGAMTPPTLFRRFLLFQAVKGKDVVRAVGNIAAAAHLVRIQDFV